MKASRIKEMMTDCYKARRNLWNSGGPGIGKTEIVEQWGGEHDVRIWFVPPAATLESVDVRGLPTITKDGRTHWAAPTFLPTSPEAEGVVYIDELPQGDRSVQCAFMQLVQSHRIGDTQYSKGLVFFVSGNRQDDRAGTHRIVTPLLNRFVHVDMEPDLADWQVWALGAGVEPSVRAFLNFKPALLYTFDPRAQQRAFATPRSWVFASDLVRHCREANRHAAVAGCVGDGPAAEYIAFGQVYRDLPDPDLLLDNPTGPIPDITKPSGPGVYYALCGALVERIRGGKAGRKKVDNFATLAARFRPEFAALAFRDAAHPAVAPDVVTTAACLTWLKKHRNLFLGGEAA